MASTLSKLPPMVPFPEAAWKDHLVPEEWEACLDAWILLAEAHLSLPAQDFLRLSAGAQSLTTFLTSFATEMATSYDISKPNSKLRQLRKQSFFLAYRLMEVDPIPEALLRWEFITDVSKTYGKTSGGKLVAAAWKRNPLVLESSMSVLKTSLAKELDAGLKGDLKTAEAKLKRLNHLLHASPEACAFFVAGSDFLDSLISCYKLMNPPLRKAIITTAYLCHIGLTDGEKPTFSTLVDQLYYLKSAADAHKAGPTSVDDSLVAELVTTTPLLKQVQHRIDASNSGSSRARSVITALEAFQKPGSSTRQVHLIRRNAKGKEKAPDQTHHDIHVHRMSLISQVQDLFPDLGSGFIVKLLDEYNDDVELVISHLLEGSLPSHLENSDRSEGLEFIIQDTTENLALHYTPAQLPTRHNVFDDDELDQLAIDTSRLHFGRRNHDQTADDLLLDRSTAPNKAAILSALAAFDSDDDERDDTYDVADVGGTIDSATPGNNSEEVAADVGDSNDEALFRAYKASSTIFNRDAETRRGKQRIALRQETGMTDEAIEGWALMLSRDPKQMRRLEAKFSTFTGGQAELAPTSWRANAGGSGTEDSDADGGGRGRDGFRGRAGRGGRGRGRGNVAGPTGDKDTEAARHKKEANKGSRANHNRRDQRAKKMARGGFPG